MSKSSRKIPLSADAQMRLSEKKQCIDPCESIGSLARKVSKMSLDSTELAGFERSLGLRDDGSCEHQSEAEESFAEIKVESIEDSDREMALCVPLEELSMLDMCNTSNRTLIYAPSNAGKSFFLIDMAIAIATGRSSMFLKPSHKSKVLYIDGELSGMFWPRVNQLYNGSDESISAYLKRINVRGRKIDNFLLDKILDIAKSGCYSVVIIDNITKIFEKAVHGNLTLMESFISSLERNGTAVVLVHHTEKSGKTYKGVMEIEALSQNILFLKGREQLQEAYEDGKIDLPQQVVDAIYSDFGPVVSVTGQKCKVCPELEGHTFFYHLPVNGTWKKIDEKNDTAEPDKITECNGAPEISLAVDNAESLKETGEASALTEPFCEHTPDERRVLEETQKKNHIRNSDVQKLLNCSDSKSSALLSKLNHDGLLRKFGNGPATGYTLTDNGRSLLNEVNVS